MSSSEHADNEKVLGKGPMQGQKNPTLNAEKHMLYILLPNVRTFAYVCVMME